MITFNQVSKQYGSTTALDSVDLFIDAGEFVFILGPSGAGKTTIRKLLIKEIEPTTGSISVGEFDYTNIRKKELPQLRQQIGVVFQDYQLIPDRTAGENIALALEITHKSNDTIKKTVPKLLDLIGLSQKANLFPGQLSGGEAQRVVIARALATDPAVIFADEPTGNLDKDNSIHVVELLKKINQHGTTIIVATHDEEIVNNTPARIINLVAGKITSDSHPKSSDTPAETETQKELSDFPKQQKSSSKSDPKSKPSLPINAKSTPEEK
jgi:cell division transport system ATP-binding protein